MERTYFGNGKIFTGQGESDFVTAMAVEGDKIIWTGSTDQISGSYVDLGGKTVLPGLIDSHIHPVYVSQVQDQCPCMPPHTETIDEIIEAMKEQAAKTPEGEWVEGWGFEESKIAEGRCPNRWDLDKVSLDRPVQIMRSCFHARVLNSKALEICGIDKDFPDIEDGVIVRDESGEPTGLLYEAAHWYAEQFKTPKTYEDQLQSIANLTKRFASMGITGVTEVMGTPEDFQMYTDAAAKGFKQHIAIYNKYINYIKDDVEPIPVTQDPEKQVRFAGLKAFLDGSISGHTAALTKAYPGTDDYGFVLGDKAELEWLYTYSRDHKLQLMIHAMGDKTIQMIIDVFKDKAPWIEGAPSVRIEHCSLLTDQMIEELAAAKIGASHNTDFLFAEIDVYNQHLDKERMDMCVRTKSCYDKLDYLSLASDSPATLWAVPEDPFMAIQAAVTRIGAKGQDLNQKEKITIQQAILLYTSKAAVMCNMPLAGQIKEGYFADFILLDKDIFTIDPADIMSISVEATYIRGEKIDF